MASRDEVMQAIRNADAAGDSSSVRKLGEYLQTIAPAPVEKTTSVAQHVGNLTAGAVRGAGSIGATLMWPIDKATDLIKGDRGQNLSGLVTGEKPLSRNEQRRADMTEALKSLGAETDSNMFAAGKIGAEIAGTMGAGGAAANALGRAGVAAPNLLQAIATNGMRGGGLGVRSAGGAISGALSAGLVNPEDAGVGAVVGGALPGAVRVAGMAGEAAGKTLRGPVQSADMAAAVDKARKAGYVIPPSQANPTLKNRLLEGFSGKLTTAQNASAKNQEITNSMAAKALGLAPDAKITPDVLNGVRDMAGKQYAAVSSAGTVTPGKAYDAALDAIAQPHLKAAAGFPNAKVNPVVDLVESMRAQAFDAGSAVSKIRELRAAADSAYASGNKELGKAAKSISTALEDTLEAHLQKTGNAQALQDFRNARQLIAKTYTVEKALNQATGTVDAQKLAGQLQRGKPLSGELRDAAEFAARFPKAAQPLEKMGSLPQTSPLDWGGASALAMLTQNPLAMASVVARPVARSAVLSPIVQNRLIQSQAPNALGQLLNDPRLARVGYGAAPALVANR